MPTATIHNIILYPFDVEPELPSDLPTVWIDPSFGNEQDRLLLQQELASFVSQGFSADDLHAVKDTVSRFFSNHMGELVLAVTPPQDLSTGTLKIMVMKGTVDRIELQGNRWTSNWWLRSQSGLKEGEPFYLSKVTRNLAWLNRSPFRRTDLFLIPGETMGTTTAQLVTEERFPFRPYIGGDNTGTEFTSRTRWYTGFYAGNLWGCDQQLSYQFTTTSDPAIFIAHSASYTIPFPWRHQLYTYGGWSRVRGDLPEPDMHNKGINWQVSPRYQIPLNPIYGNLLQEISIGYDFKRTNNGLIFGDTADPTTSADINQFMLGYSFDYRTSTYSTSILAELFFSPFILTADQTNARYQAIRPFAQDRYVYGKIRASHTHSLPWDFSVKGSLVGQGTGWNLMPSEQFGIGGYDTVRGYEERGLNVDDAVLASIELNSPSMRLFHWKNTSSMKERLYFLAFLDYGWGAVHRAIRGEESTAWMLGIGPGMRYACGSHILFRADVGFPLHRAGLGRQGIHVHVGGTLSF